jgi:hypothetical protein
MQISLKSPHKRLRNALMHLAQSFDTLEKSRNNPVFFIAAQEACIKRFENSFDSFLRFSQIYMKHHYDVEIFDEPDSVFNFYAQFNMCSYEDKNVLYAMVADRQRLAEFEDLDSAQSLILRIPAYYLIMNKIIRSITIEE